MYLQFIGVEGTIINLANIAMIDDESDEKASKVVLTTTAGEEFVFEGADADAIFSRVAVLVQATDLAIAQFSQLQPGANQ